MKNTPQLFTIIGDSEITLISGRIDEKNNFELLEKLFFPIEGIGDNKILDLEKIINLIKKNTFLIEQKVNYIFKDIIIILDNLEISFLNFSGFKKLNGTQISKENITYLLNSLKSCVDEFEKSKKILHIFNSEYCLDKKKLDNLPIGLFGDFYSHELSFNLINKTDHKNLENIFKKCNLKIKKILLESFVRGSLINEKNPKVDTFLYVQIKNENSKIFFVENNSIKFEQKFNFGTDIILKDISKITSLSSDTIKQVISDNENINKLFFDELLEEKYFINQQYRKIKKKLILEIAEARIQEICKIFYLKNINLKKKIEAIDLIFLDVDDLKHFKCFHNTYKNNFALNNTYGIKVVRKLSVEEIANKAINIVQFGWNKEVIPFTKSKKSIIARVFQQIFN